MDKRGLALKEMAFQNIAWNGEYAGNQYFVLFLTTFSTLSQTEIIIVTIFNLLSANALKLVKSRYLLLGVYTSAKRIGHVSLHRMTRVEILLL